MYEVRYEDDFEQRQALVGHDAEIDQRLNARQLDGSGVARIELEEVVDFRPRLRYAIGARAGRVDEAPDLEHRGTRSLADNLVLFPGSGCAEVQSSG